MKYPTQAIHFLGQTIKIITFDFSKSKRKTYNSETNQYEPIHRSIGVCTEERNEIWVDSRLSSEKRLTTLWHECTHLVSDKVGGDLTEKQVQIIGELLYGLVIDNLEILLPARVLKQKRGR